ncbi:putative Smr domain protein [Legionella beliardensis]|uniref:Putative Smr domain protein n=1 Tax=Legionella beliardensis TaxID=91822 RepID=A0A378I4K4_9GAMM|nr:hypothetical protein [Legionella beliardensis]STX29626.1 putative Smr domain protein [Legionella beliardensis]
MNEIDDEINLPVSLQSDKRRLLYLKNKELKKSSEKSQSGILGKLSERLTGRKRKAVASGKEASTAVPKRSLIRRPISVSSSALPDVGRLDIPTNLSDRETTRKRKASILGEDTPEMARKRRLIEQDGHRQLAKVHAREHSAEEDKPAPEGELQNSIKQHPWLDAQRFDGIDPNLNPEPPLNTAARREYDNERREQEMEKQLRLGNMPKFSTAPKPGLK